MAEKDNSLDKRSRGSGGIQRVARWVRGTISGGGTINSRSPVDHYSSRDVDERDPRRVAYVGPEFRSTMSRITRSCNRLSGGPGVEAGRTNKFGGKHV
jgi:hypothetical protein